MKGDGEDWVVRDYLSLGSSTSRNSARNLTRSTSSSGEREQICANSSGQQQDHALNLGMLLHLSRNGLNMLAGGGANGGTFSLKPPAVGMPSLQKFAAGERPSGGFTSLSGYRSARPVPKMLPTAMGMGMRFGEMSVKEEAIASSSYRCSIGDRVDQGDVQKLTTDECWRLILKLGTQWPAWNGAAKSSLATQGLKENDSTVEASDYGHPLQNEERLQAKEKPGTLPRGQDFLKLLAMKALEALAQTPPDSHSKAAGGMLAPKQTTQEVMDSKAAGDTFTKVTEPTPLAKGPSSSREVLASKPTSTRPRTAALTIFYDGIVNVCDDVPADKARLIMMFAKKAGVSLSAQALLQNEKCDTPSLQPSAQLPTPTATSQEDDLHHAKRSSQVASPDETSCAPPSASHGEGSTSDQGPPESANPAKTAISEPSPNPHKLTITTEGVSSRPPVVVKPLPNARKNSLARFLDSRKRDRGTASCSEGGSPKKQALGNECCLKFGCPNDSDHDLKPSLCSQSCSNCNKAISRRATPDAEMRDYFVE